MIEVRLNKSDVNSLGAQGGREYIMSKLRAAGIPFSPMLMYVAGSGVLTHFVDALFDDIVYQWEPAADEQTVP